MTSTSRLVKCDGRFDPWVRPPGKICRIRISFRWDVCPTARKDWNGPRIHELEGQPASRASEYRITGIMADRGASVWLARGAQIATEYS